MITAGNAVKFRSPEDDREYIGTVISISRNGIAKIRYEHNYFGELIEQNEYISTPKLELAR